MKCSGFVAAKIQPHKNITGGPMKKILLLGIVLLVTVWVFRSTQSDYMLDAKNAQG